MNEEQLEQEGQGFVAGAVLGAIAGGIAAMLLTPKTGREMRAIVREYAKEWEGEAGDFAEEARKILNTIKDVIDDGTEEIADHAPAIAERTAEVANHTVETVADTYETTRDTVSEMVETFRSQWQELEEDRTLAHHHNARFRGVNRTWQASTETDEEKENDVYVEELQEDADDRPARPTLAQYRQSARAAQKKSEPISLRARAEADEESEKKPAPKDKDEEDKKPAKKPASRKLLFRHK